MPHNQEIQTRQPLSLQKAQVNHEHERGGATSAEMVPETGVQIVIGNGLPALIGATAAMAVAGSSLVPTLAVGFVAFLATTLVRSHSIHSG